LRGVGEIGDMPKGEKFTTQGEKLTKSLALEII
jgi:hypothetical protein